MEIVVELVGATGPPVCNHIAHSNECPINYRLEIASAEATMMKTEEEARKSTTAGAETSADGGGGGGGSLKKEVEEEEEIEEDVIEDRLAESSDKPPEDARDDVKGKPAEDTTDGSVDKPTSVSGEKEQFVQHNNQIQYATSSSQRGAIAEIPDEINIDVGATATAEIPHETTSIANDSAVFNNGGEEDVQPGFMFVAGPGYTGTGIHTGYHSDPDHDGDINEESMIVEGFLPEDDPSRRRNPNVESLTERVQRLIDNAITLEDSAVVPIPMGEAGDEEESNGLEQAAQSNSVGNDDEKEKSDNCRWLLPLWGLVLAACIILAVALPLSLRGKSEDAAQDATLSLSDAICLPGEVDVRFELAKSILSSITSLDLLEDDSTPQGKAIQWIVCADSISVQLLENQDPSTGKLPKQKHGFILGGDSGEAQVTRRYILAVFSFSTTQANPWRDSLNFLTPDLHECDWYKNYKRENFPFGGEWEFFYLCFLAIDLLSRSNHFFLLLVCFQSFIADFDPVGVLCITDGLISTSLMKDEDFLYDNLVINFRSKLQFVFLFFWTCVEFLTSFFSFSPRVQLITA